MEFYGRNFWQALLLQRRERFWARSIENPRVQRTVASRKAVKQLATGTGGIKRAI